MFFVGAEIHLILKHGHREVDNVAQEFLIVGNLLQRVLERVADLVLCRQEHRQVLRLLQRLGVRHDLQKLSCPVWVDKGLVIA